MFGVLFYNASLYKDTNYFYKQIWKGDIWRHKTIFILDWNLVAEFKDSEEQGKNLWSRKMQDGSENLLVFQNRND